MTADKSAALDKFMATLEGFVDAKITAHQDRKRVDKAVDVGREALRERLSELL